MQIPLIARRSGGRYHPPHAKACEPAMITRIDHVVLTVRSLEATCAFYKGDPDGNLVEVSKYGDREGDR